MGSNVTHIANASGERIKVAYSERTMVINQIQITNNNMMINFENNGSIVTEFDIPNKCFHRYERRNSDHLLTVITFTNSRICENYRLPQNKSYIITRRGEIVQQDEGNSNLFMDRYGRDHF